MQTYALSRRSFLKAGGSLVVTFSLAGLGRSRADDASTPGFATKTVALDEVDGFIAVGADGKVTVFSGKVDLGTGVETALAQIAAEELEVPVPAVQVVQGDTLLTPDQGTTFGSLTIQNGGMQIRQAAATAREALLVEGAKRLGVPRADVVASRGFVEAPAAEKRIGYGALIGGKRLSLKLDPKAPLKDPARYAVVGKPMPRLDIPDKVMGRFTYVHDFKVRGMLHARVLRPTSLGGKLLSVDDAAARRVKGWITTVRKGSFLAVVARTEWAAVKAAEAVKASWSSWEGLPDQSRIWEHVRATKVSSDEVVQSAGNTVEAMQGASRKLTAVYDFASHTHGSQGPSCAVAEYKAGKLTCWTASQATHMLRVQLAQMLGMSEQDVRCVYVAGSGCFGRNGHEDAAADAALIARELGKAVRVQWSRADEHGWDPKSPPTLLEYRGALDAAGNLVAWESEAFVPEKPKQPLSVTLVAAALADLPRTGSHPGNIHNNLAHPYAVPNLKATVHWLAETPLRPGWLRTPGRMQNTYGNESFIDECAAAAGVDPIEYRRRHFKDARGLELIERLVKLSGWTARPTRGGTTAGDVASGRGMSFVKFEMVRTYAGVVADVEVNTRTGAVKVKRIYIAHDCGQVINPDGLRNQIEGNMVQTVSRTLFEEVKFDHSKVTSCDWASYPILTFPDAPEVIVDIIDRPNEKPWGAGEPSAAVVPSAIANAIYDAIGVRLRSVPFTPKKVLAAIKQV